MVWAIARGSEGSPEKACGESAVMAQIYFSFFSPWTCACYLTRNGRTLML